MEIYSSNLSDIWLDAISLNGQDKKKEAKKDEISLEELVESERAGLGPNQTKVTLESFLAWKKRKLREREAARLEETDRKKKEFKAGKSHGVSCCLSDFPFWVSRVSFSESFSAVSRTVWVALTCIAIIQHKILRLLLLQELANRWFR